MVGSPCKFDYVITFRDAQRLELIRRRLLKAALILRSNADVGVSLKGHIENLSHTMECGDISTSLQVLDQYVRFLNEHARVVDFLLERLAGTNKLVRSGSIRR